MSWMFKLRGTVSPMQSIVFGFIGFILLLLLWAGVTAGELPLIEAGILPKPGRVFSAFGELCSENNLIKELCLSLGFNFGGYIKALLFSLPIGFLIGLFPVFKATFQSQINAYRFIPLTAVTSIFIASFGIGTPLKINFLAFGIMIYLIPIIIQRINEVKDVYLKTVYTIGATNWQTIKTVYIPSVLSKLSDDIRVLTAISWTYIIVAEGIGDQGGLGSLIYRVGQRMGRPDKTFAILALFILIGIIQDRLFLHLDKKFFPFKYQTKERHAKTFELPDSLKLAIDFISMIVGWVLVAIYVLLVANELFGFLGEFRFFDYFFQDTSWVVHVIFLSILSYKIYPLFSRSKTNTK